MEETTKNNKKFFFLLITAFILLSTCSLSLIFFKEEILTLFNQKDTEVKEETAKYGLLYIKNPFGEDYEVPKDYEPILYKPDTKEKVPFDIIDFVHGYQYDIPYTVSENGEYIVRNNVENNTLEISSYPEYNEFEEIIDYSDLDSPNPELGYVYISYVISSDSKEILYSKTYYSTDEDREVNLYIYNIENKTTRKLDTLTLEKYDVVVEGDMTQNNMAMLIGYNSETGRVILYEGGRKEEGNDYYTDHFYILSSKDSSVLEDFYIDAGFWKYFDVDTDYYNPYPRHLVFDSEFTTAYYSARSSLKLPNNSLFKYDIEKDSDTLITTHDSLVVDPEEAAYYNSIYFLNSVVDENLFYGISLGMYKGESYIYNLLSGETKYLGNFVGRYSNSDKYLITEEYSDDDDTYDMIEKIHIKNINNNNSEVLEDFEENYENIYIIGWIKYER